MWSNSTLTLNPSAKRHRYCNSALYYKCGGRDRWAGFLIAGVIIGFVVAGTSPVTYVPRCVAALMMLHLGVDLMKEALWDPRHVLTKVEYATMLLVVCSMTGLGFGPGIGIGVLAAVAVFVVQISRMPPVRSLTTALALARSSDAIQPYHGCDNQAIVDAGLAMVCICRLQGLIFFGNIIQVRENVERYLDQQVEAWKGKKRRASESRGGGGPFGAVAAGGGGGGASTPAAATSGLVIDCTAMGILDFSAVSVLSDLVNSLCSRRGLHVAFCGVGPRTTKILKSLTSSLHPPPPLPAAPKAGGVDSDSDRNDRHRSSSSSSSNNNNVQGRAPPTKEFAALRVPSEDTVASPVLRKPLGTISEDRKVQDDNDSDDDDLDVIMARAAGLSLGPVSYHATLGDAVLSLQAALMVPLLSQADRLFMGGLDAGDQRFSTDQGTHNGTDGTAPKDGDAERDLADVPEGQNRADVALTARVLRSLMAGVDGVEGVALSTLAKRFRKRCVASGCVLWEPGDAPSAVLVIAGHLKLIDVIVAADIDAAPEAVEMLTDEHGKEFAKSSKSFTQRNFAGVMPGAMVGLGAYLMSLDHHDTLVALRPSVVLFYYHFGDAERDVEVGGSTMVASPPSGMSILAGSPAAPAPAQGGGSTTAASSESKLTPRGEGGGDDDEAGADRLSWQLALLAETYHHAHPRLTMPHQVQPSTTETKSA